MEPAGGSDGTDGRWRIARRVAPDRVVSTVDREARHTRKSKPTRRDGFRGHVAAEPGTGLISGCEMTMAAGDGSSDAGNGVKMAARDRFHRTGPGPAAAPAAADGDDAAGTGAGGNGGQDGPQGQGGAAPGGAGPGEAPGQAARAADPQHATAHPGPAGCAHDSAGPQPASDHAQPPAGGTARGWKSTATRPTAAARPGPAYRDAGHDTVIKPKPLQPAVPGGFTLDDFTISQGERTVTCPAGHTRPMSKSRTVTFGALCAGCPLRSKCTTANDGRSMTIHPHEGLLREARAQARTKTFKQAYPTRSAIERIISWTATQNGRRVRLRYIGTSKTTPGCTTGAPRSTSAPCSTPGWPAATGPGCWPNQPGSPHGPAAGALRARPRPFPRAPWPHIRFKLVSTQGL